VKATKSDEESVALQAIEFWSAVCEEEVDRQEDIEEQDGQDPEVGQCRLTLSKPR
jgi:importin subunit beta-1